MDGMPNNNFGSSPFTPPSSMATAPPPPSEVKVRTMRSDLDAMAKSGGGVPRFENVKVTGLSLEKQSAEAAAAGKGKSNAVLVLIVIAIVAVLAIIGYFVYRFFFAGTGAPAPAEAQAGTTQSTPAPTAPLAAAPSSPSAPSSTSPAQAGQAVGNQSSVPFIHATLFKKPADQTLILKLSSGGVASSAADLQTFNQKLSTLLAGAQKAASVIEIDVTDANGHGVPIGALLTQAGAAVLDPSFLAAHFNDDATFFVYQDKSGFWPAYILSLKPSENWLFLKADVAKLESSPALTNLFLTNIGTSSRSAFVDGSVSGTPMRISSFPNANPPASFVYGWYQNYLILSTSQNGFAQALTRL